MQKRVDNQYTFKSRVRFSEVDHREKLTLPGIINYFQDCSTFQSESLGLGVEYFAQHKKAWVLSSWQIKVKRYPVLGEQIEVATWATTFKGILGGRNFCMEDGEGRQIACANSVWVYMDMEKGRPVKPDKAEVEAYGSGEPLDFGETSRKIALPERLKEERPFLIRRYHIDTNEHVNNCQYVQMAMELLDENEEIGQVRAEYKNQAVYGNIIIPKVAKEKDRTVAELCSDDGKVYAVVEFQK